MAGLMAVPAMAWGTCGPGGTVRDWGLRLAWVVQQDCDHPERPARLLEVPWSQPNAPGAENGAKSGAGCAAPGQSREKPSTLPAPEVRAGMRVTLWRRNETTEVHLDGTALGTARTGEAVAVKAGLHGATLRGTVRGPGRVELEPEKGGR